MVPGRIYRHEQFYLDRDTGLLKPKYFLVLAVQSSGDCVARLLTSRAHGRPEQPPCFHGTPYPGYFLGIPGQGLGVRTWIDLRFLEDFDGLDFQRLVARSLISFRRVSFRQSRSMNDRGRPSAPIHGDECADLNQSLGLGHQLGIGGVVQRRDLRGSRWRRGYRP